MQLTEFLQGAVAGAVATIPMTLVMEGVAPFLPPQEHFALPPHLVTAQTAARFGLRRRPGQRTRSVLTDFAHVGYGAAVGAPYAPLAARLPVPPLLSGVAYGLAVWAASYSGLLPALRIIAPPAQQPSSRNMQLILSHIVWGATLGSVTTGLCAISQKR
ncbi:MAG: DUF1440 domain-containing protein [Caldilineaceae bacterium]|nr:DUF1440 domain-containing protein [Caldilineaceae bacterium]